jgi:DNA-binding SARP family transcriptional activator
MARVRVRIEMLGGFAVRVGGRELALGRKVPRRPLDLLRYLAVHAGRQLPEGEVAGALWPGRAPAAAIRALAVTLHRLRRLLGVPEAILRREGRIGVDPRTMWCDCAAFERLLAEAARCGERRRRMALTAGALELYRGEFLAGETRAAWVLPVRARLHESYVLACRDAAAARPPGARRIRNRSVIRAPLPSEAPLESREVES